MDESHPYAEYPRDAMAVPPGPQLYAKDGKLAIYVGAASGIGRLQHGFRALGFGGGHQAGAILISILLFCGLQERSV